jgi:hypothetical protein
MNRLLIYIGEAQKFDVESTIKSISTMKRVRNARRGEFIGSIFECDFAVDDHPTIIRFSSDAETVTAEGLGDDSLEFALEFQSISPITLYVTDMGYNFNVALGSIKTVSEFKKAIRDHNYVSP